MIRKEDIIKDRLPDIIYAEDGGVNVVLALNSEKIYCATNTYMPRWTVVNTAYYNKNPQEFDGWIELENVPTPNFN